MIEPSMGYGGSSSPGVQRLGQFVDTVASAEKKPPAPDLVAPPSINFKNVPGTGPRPSPLSVKKVNAGKGSAASTLPPAKVLANVAPGQGSLKKTAQRTDGVLDALRPTLGVL